MLVEKYMGWVRTTGIASRFGSKQSQRTRALLASVLAVPVMTSLGQAAYGQLYWDANGTADGSGTTPTGTWGSDLFWNDQSDGTDGGGFGTIGAWTDGQLAVFSAGNDASGAYTVTVTGTQTAGGINIQTGTLTLSGGNLTLSSPSINVSAASATISSAIIGTGNTLTKDGTGNLTLSGTNTYTGATTINSGLLIISSDARLGTAPTLATPDFLTINDATLRTTATMTLNANRGITLGSGTPTIEVTSGTLTYGGIATGSSLKKIGTGTLILSGPNTFTGATSVNAGVLAVSNATGLGTIDSGTTVSSGAALQVSGAITIAEPLTISGTGINNAGALRKTGSNTTVLTGGVILNADSRINADANTLSFTTADINNNGYNLTVGGNGNSSFTAKITGSGTLIKDGTGNLTFANNNGNYTGKTVINAGNITYNFQVGTGVGPMGPNPTGGPVADFITLNGGSMTDAATGNGGTALDPNKGIYLGANGGTWSLTDSTAANVHIYRGPISGVGGFTKAGVGTLAITGVFGQFDGVETYAGPTTISAGILRLRQEGTSPNFVTGQLPSATALTINTGGTFDMASFNQTVGSFSGAGSLVGNTSAGIFTMGGSNAAPLTFSGNITSTTGIATTMKLTKNGTGTEVLTGTNLNTGAITVNGGVLEFGTAASLGGSGANMTVASGGTAAAGYAMDQAFLGRITIGSGGVAALAADSSNNLDVSGFSNLRLGAVGAATYTGTLTTGSTYRLGGGGGALTLANPITDGKDLSIDSNGTASGTVILTGTNKFGAVSVSSGMLDVGSGALVLTNTSTDSLRGMLLSGRNAGTWNGTGIISSIAAADASHLTAVGYLSADDLGVVGGSWAGLGGVVSGNVLTKVTLYGDINLDGSVTRDDLALMDRGLAKYATGVIASGQAHWLNGDVNYDGIVDSNDYLLVDTVLAHNGLLSPGILATQEAEFGAGFTSQVLAVVPEPTSLGLLAFAAAPLLGRRRRRETAAD